MACRASVVLMTTDQAGAAGERAIEWVRNCGEPSTELVLVDEHHAQTCAKLSEIAGDRFVALRHVGLGGAKISAIGYDAGIIASTGDVLIFTDDPACVNVAEHLAAHASGAIEYRADGAASVKRSTAIAARKDKLLTMRAVETPANREQRIDVPRNNRKLRVCMVYGAFSSAIHGPFDIAGLYTRTGLTGSESSFFNLARSLSEFGHEVAVFCDVAEPTSHASGFQVLPLSAVERMAELVGVDAVIAWNEPDYLRFAPKGARRYCDQQLNDFGYCRVPGWQSLADTWVSPSANHRANVMAPERFSAPVVVIPNSVDLSLYDGDAPTRDSKRVVYCSSPDRGLHHLLSMWPTVRERVPGAELHVFYRLAPWLDRAKDMPDEVGHRARYIAAVLPALARYGVVVRDLVPNAVMARELQAAKVLAYPCDPVRYTEGFGCSVLDAAAGGCVPIISAADALPEVHGSASVGIAGAPGSVTDAWVQAITDALAGDYDDGAREPMRAHAQKHSRENVARQWESLLLD